MKPEYPRDQSIEWKRKRLRQLLWSAGNGQLPQWALDKIKKLKKELASLDK
jgi:hypothetical protein